jgi:hypothetical protein
MMCIKNWFIWHQQDQRGEALQFTSYENIIPNM